MINQTQFSVLVSSLFTQSAPSLEDDFRSHDEWCSLMLLDLMAGIEDDFGIALNVNEIESCRTFAEILQLMENKHR